MLTPVQIPAELLRARRTAASARGSMAIAGILICALEPGAARLPAAAIAGFAILAVSAAFQTLTPTTVWLKLDESLAPISSVLIIGLGSEHVNVISMLWLGAVASGVLARGGRIFWVGRALLLASLALPIIREQRLTFAYACMCLATITLLLTCGRVTQELRALLDRARHDADHDGLTGALSRAAFRARLDRVTAEASADDPAALILLDLDNFGAINKLAGHSAGDQVLAGVARHMRRATGEGAIVGRLGGDEFGAIFRAATPETCVQRLLDDLAAENVRGQPVVASVGIALIPRDGDDVESLLSVADIALRVAKSSGRHQLAVYAGKSISDPGPGGAREALEDLIAGNGLSMAVQPIVAMPEGVPHAYEALARFQTEGSTSPLHWFALADELGARDRLELRCLEIALGLLDTRPPGSLLSVNLSGPLLLDPRAQTLLRGVREPNRLIVELTENSLIEDTQGLRAEISDLSATGIRFAVDDMGAGYSGLRQITALHPTYLKLDRSLISGIESDPDRGALVSAMVGYARQTGGHVVAEGVETAAELDTLKGLGVGLVQGYYLARPGWPWPQVSKGAVRRSAVGAGAQVANGAVTPAAVAPAA